MKDSVGHASGGFGDRLQCSRESVLEVSCGFCVLSLGSRSIYCSGCLEKFHPDKLFMGVEERDISVLLEDKIMWRITVVNAGGCQKVVWSC